jgi:hypothetical protein
MAVTDYKTECGSMARTGYQMLASCIFGYHDLAGLLHYRINATGYSGDCTDLSDLLDCDTSHITEESQLVENVFAIDECTNLTLKAFANSSTPAEYSECGEIPQSLIRMLARCIVSYSNITMLNSFTATDVCTALTALLTCSTNAIESERLLVQNLFALDDCNRLGLKLFLNTSAFTDYTTGCGELHESFIELLARCIVEYNNVYYLNVVSVSGTCDDLHAFWTCDNGHIEPERALEENVFAVDDCGNLALKWYVNSGAEDRQ